MRVSRVNTERVNTRWFARLSSARKMVRLAPTQTCSTILVKILGTYYTLVYASNTYKHHQRSTTRNAEDASRVLSTHSQL